MAIDKKISIPNWAIVGLVLLVALVAWNVLGGSNVSDLRDRANSITSGLRDAQKQSDSVANQLGNVADGLVNDANEAGRISNGIGDVSAGVGAVSEGLGKASSDIGNAKQRIGTSQSELNSIDQILERDRRIFQEVRQRGPIQDQKANP